MSERIEQLTEQHTEELGRLMGQPITPPLVKRLHACFGESLAGLMLDSAALQAKAQQQLGDGQWWVTRDSLQKATAWQVAAAKANWFPVGDVYDLCCGVGGDAIQLATSRHVIAVDRDPLVATAANANLRGRSAKVLCDDVESMALPRTAWIHVDPNRRIDGQRFSDVHQYQPNWDVLSNLMSGVQGGVIKLAPAAEIADSSGVVRVWISLAGKVREQSLVFGELAKSVAPKSLESGRMALLLAKDGSQSMYVPASDFEPALVAEKPSQWMIDPDAAIRAAGLTERFSHEFDAAMLGGPSGFLTSGSFSDDIERLATVEPVLWSGSADDRKLRRELRALDAYPKRVKTRGVSLDPNQMEKRYRSCGERPVTLWLGRNGKRVYAVVTQHGENG